jgi:Ca-activated chloride channel family protein
MTLDRPEFLWLGLLALPELLLILGRTPRLERSLGALAGPELSARLRARHATSSIYGAVFSLLFICSAVLALAGPAWGSRAVSAERSGLEVSVVLDVSRSMLARDSGASRLDQGKEIIRSLLGAAPDASFSLVAAKGDAVLLVPMTDDIEAMDSGLDYADPETLSAAGTDLDAGIRAGLASFTGKSGASRVLVLLSDGGEHGSDATAAAAEAKRRKVRIVTMGLGGSDALPVPGPTGSPLLDSHGVARRSALESEPLKRVASTSGGRYLEASDPAAQASLETELAQIGAGGKRTEYEVQDRTSLFAVLALAFLVGRILASLASQSEARR